MTEVSKTFSGSSILSSPANNSLATQGYFFIDKNNLMVYYGVRKLKQLVWKTSKKTNGVESGVDD